MNVEVIDSHGLISTGQITRESPGSPNRVCPWHKWHLKRLRIKPLLIARSPQHGDTVFSIIDYFEAAAYTQSPGEAKEKTAALP